MFLASAVLLLASVTTTTATAFSATSEIAQTVILIRHGEKDDGNDLDARGSKRARCLASHFASYGITHLYAYADKKSQRSTETLQPLSEAIGISIDTKWKRDDVSGLVSGIASLPSNAIALVCWEHTVLSKIAGRLGVKEPPDYPNREYDWQWTIIEGSLGQQPQWHENC